MSRILLITMAVGGAVWLLPQDPKERPAPPPAGATPLPAVEEPYVSPVPRLDLQQRFDRVDPLEGFWELRARVMPGAVPAQVAGGWMVVGRRHLMIYLQGGGPAPAVPLLRAGVRRWRRDGERIFLTVLGGHFNDASGDIAVERPQTAETRRIEMIGSTVRIYQDERSWLEFVRVE